MAKLYSYTKHQDDIRTINLLLPFDLETHTFVGQELCVLGGITYVSMPDTAVLPQQPGEIAASVKVVTLTEALKADIKDNCKLFKRINDQVVENIRLKYSADDEIKALRLAPSVTTEAWKAYVEECVLAGMEQKAALGL